MIQPQRCDGTTEPRSPRPERQAGPSAPRAQGPAPLRLQPTPVQDTFPISREQRNRCVSTSSILLARLIAALVNVAPPLVGSYAFGRETYGSVASVLAIASMVFGMVGQYLSQNLLRALCTAEQAERAVAAAILFCAACIGMVGALSLSGTISTLEGGQLAILVVNLTLLRICEVHLITTQRIVASIAVFFASPPLLCSLFFLVAGWLGGGHAAAAIAQAAAYSIAALIGLLTATEVKKLLLHALRTPVATAAKEIAHSLPLLVSGSATTAADFLPIILLRDMGALSVIPVYEIARKIASIPTTLANPLLNQANPAMIRAFTCGDMPEIHRLLRKMFRMLSFVGILFLLCTASMLVGGLYIARVQDISVLLLPLALGSFVAMWCTPHQSLLIASRGDRWFTASSAASVILLLALTYLGSRLGPALAVSCAVGFSMAVGALMVRHHAIKVLTRAKSGSDAMSPLRVR